MSPTSLIHRLEHPTVGVPAWKGDTIVSALSANARRYPDRVAMRTRDQAGAWEPITWAGYQMAVSQASAGLVESGVAPGGRVAILGSNRPEWHIADLATMAAGGVSVPVYPTSSPAQIAYILRHAEVSVCVVDGHAQLSRVLEVKDDLPGLRRIVLMDGDRRATDTAVVAFDELRALGADRLVSEPDLVRRLSSRVGPSDLATVVYTSGTTGPPKGAMISHGNIIWTIRSVAPVYGLGEGERLLSFLPLSHIAERMMSDFLPIAVTGETWFARSMATVADDLPACRPTVFLAVPRVWEKLREGIETQIHGQPWAVRTAIESYLALGQRAVDLRQAGQSPPPVMEAARLSLDGLLGAAIRRRVGLDQARIVVTAAAPAHPDLIRWFHAIGLPLVQIYGQTEGCGPTTANRPDRIKIGTVGEALPGMQVRVADDGEILLRGGNVCMGYLEAPEATAELIDADGWMHTGDTGEFDAEGSLRVTGRKKDLIITASGKNVAPQNIEVDLSNHPLISEAVVVGEGHKYLGALLTLDSEGVTQWAKAHDKLADVELLSADPDLMAEIEAAVEDVNRRRSRAESIRRFRILPHDLTTAAGELTPTMKVKRPAVFEHYADVIDELYAGS